MAPIIFLTTPMTSTVQNLCVPCPSEITIQSLDFLCESLTVNGEKLVSVVQGGVCSSDTGEGDWRVQQSPVQCLTDPGPPSRV